MARVQNLDSIQSGSHESCDPLACTETAGMREHGKPTSAMDQRDCINHRELILGDKRRPSVAEKLIEGFAQIAGPTARDNSTRDVWATNSSAGGFLEDCLHCYSDAELIESLHDPRGAVDAHLAERDQLVLELHYIGEMEAEDVRLDHSFDSTELDSIDESNADFARGCTGFNESRHRVVIGERERLETHCFCGARDVGGRARPI
jgi:hypothetical protein